MIIFQESYLQKSTALILSICMIGLITGPALFYPKKAQAICPISIATSAPDSQQTAAQTGWESLKSAFRSGNLTNTLTTASELVAANAGEIAKWTAGVLLNMMIHQLLAQITNDIVNWIENGQEPRFMSEGFGGYLEDAFDNAAGNFIDQMLGVGLFCEPFDLDLKLALLDVPTFDAQAECTLSEMVDNIDNFYEDFDEGGWKGWIELSKPQNNFYGSIILAQDELNSIVVQTERNIDMESKDGWLPARDCVWYDAEGSVVQKISNVRGVPALPSACKGGWTQTDGITKPCNLKCETWTPADTISETANKTVNNWMDTMNEKIAGATANAGPYQVYLQAVAGALMNRIMKEGVGLLKAEDEKVPGYGDLGAAADIPQTSDPQTAEQNKIDAAALFSQFSSLEQNITNQLLNEQSTNLAVMESIPTAYQDILPDLDLVINTCSTTPYSSYATWAQTAIDDISNIVPIYNSQINQMKTVDIPETITLINDVKNASVSAQDLTNKSDSWLDAYEQAGGITTDTALQTAATEMNEARNTLIVDSQNLITLINGTAISTTLSGLVTEIMNSNTTIVTMAQNLIDARGDATFPDSGTLYADLEAASTMEDDAQTKTNTCQSWIAQQAGGT